MSRILRRPMFRGGPVDSYGTGIATGLASGGRVGYDNGGQILKKAKARRGSTIRVKTARTKRATGSRRIAKLNKPTSLKRNKISRPGRSISYGKRKSIRK